MIEHVEMDEMERERGLFEAAMYGLYLKRLAEGKIAQPLDAGDGSPEALFWRQPNGEYGVLMFNAAWAGWRAAKGLPL